MENFHTIVADLGALSYVGIFGATLFANMLPGLPEEIFLIALGYAIGKHIFIFWVCLIIVISALFSTDNALYFISRRGNKIVRAIGNFLLGGTLEQKLPFIEKHVGSITFFSRFLFQARFLGPFLSGTVHYPWKKFAIRQFAALSIFVPSCFLIGMYFENRIEDIINGVGIFGNIVLLVFAIIIMGFVMKLIKKHVFNDMEYHAENVKQFFGFTKKEDIIEN